MPPRLDSSQLLGLHRRLCDGDRTASEELAELILEPLIDAISRRFPRSDEQTIWDGVVDALLDYCARPHQFDEERGVPLDRFLCMASRHNVTNLLRGETRRRAREEAAQSDARSVVELDPTAGNILQQEETRELQRQQEGMMERLSDPRDQQVLALRLQGERRTEAFAEILGISHLPIEAQRRAVKRTKDRIDKILRRHGGRHDASPT
jgi:RNA polymerase sigma-70 factor, ECF subfamily